MLGSSFLSPFMFRLVFHLPLQWPAPGCLWPTHAWLDSQQGPEQQHQVEKGSSGPLNWWDYVGVEIEGKWEMSHTQVLWWKISHKPPWPFFHLGLSPAHSSEQGKLPCLKCFRNKLQSTSWASVILHLLSSSPPLLPPFCQYVAYSTLSDHRILVHVVYFDYSSPSVPTPFLGNFCCQSGLRLDILWRNLP